VRSPPPPCGDGDQTEAPERDPHATDREEPVEGVGERDRDGCGSEADAADYAEESGHPVAEIPCDAAYQGQERDPQSPRGIGQGVSSPSGARDPDLRTPFRGNRWLEALGTSGHDARRETPK
jgi:hypothetical protein